MMLDLQKLNSLEQRLSENLMKADGKTWDQEFKPYWVNYRTDIPDCLHVIREFADVLKNIKGSNMSNCFHLAIEGGDLKTTLPFYTDVLGCELGPNEEGKWQDIDFWGNELTLHQTTPRKQKSEERERHDVDMGAVCVPHFGVHLPWDTYVKVKERIEEKIGFYDNPYIRFEGKDTQQETFFVEDPNYNMLEIKSIQGTYYE